MHDYAQATPHVIRGRLGVLVVTKLCTFVWPKLIHWHVNSHWKYTRLVSCGRTGLWRLPSIVDDLFLVLSNKEGFEKALDIGQTV